MFIDLRQHLARLHRQAGTGDRTAVSPLGIPAVDSVLGGGLLRGAVHEIAALSEAHLPAASGFALGLAALADDRKYLVWIAEDMALAESGVPYGAGLDVFGLKPQRLITVSAAHRPELMWAMEEALLCRSAGIVIGELRHGTLDPVAVRRLSLAASKGNALAFLLRAQPSHDASTATTRWMVETAASLSERYAFGPPRFAVHLTRNRRGPPASWILEWRDTDERFILAAHAEPVAAPLRHRPHQKIA